MAGFAFRPGVIAVRLLAVAVICSGAGQLAPSTARADNSRLNNAVISGVYTIQHQAGCTNDVIGNNQLTLSAQWHADDMMGNRNINGDIGSDGTTPQDRANAAGFRGKVSETIATNPAMAISSLDVINQWYYNPDDMAIIRDCAYTVMGVWSENSIDRTVLVAMYGQPAPRAR